MAGGMESFLRGSQIGGGRASKAIAKNMSSFGYNGDEDIVDPNSLQGITAKAMDQTNGEQKGGDLALILKSLGENNELAGPVGDTQFDPDVGAMVAQPGSLSIERQNKLQKYSDLSSHPLIQKMMLDQYIQGGY